MILLIPVVPGNPSEPNATCLTQDTATTLYRLKWKPPQNVNEFDFAHYQLMTANGQNRLSIIDGARNSTVVDLANNISEVIIVTVDMCNQNSSGSLITLNRGDNPSTSARLTQSPLTVLLTVCILVVNKLIN